MTITFDTASWRRWDFHKDRPRTPAEALADSLGKVSDLATKADLADLKAEFKATSPN